MLRIVVIALVAANLLLLVLEATKPPRDAQTEAETRPPSQLDPQLPEIRLLSELTDAGRQARCFMVGPFENAEAAEDARGALAAIAESVSSREAEALVERGYWVYLPPFETVEGARIMANEMLAAGITDVEVFLNGEWDKSISLGYFVNESNALARRDEIRGRGFDAQTRIQQETAPRFWLDYEQLTGSHYAARLLADTIPPELHQPIPCISVSPAEDAGEQSREFNTPF